MSGYYYQAVHSYAARNPTQLSFESSERLEIVTKASKFPGWWVAKNKAGKEGLVPHNYFILSADSAEFRPDENAYILPSTSLSARDGVRYLDGCRSLPNGSVELPDGNVKNMEQVPTPTGAIRHADGVFQYPDGTRELPSGAMVRPSGEFLNADGEIRPLKWKLPSSGRGASKSVSRQRSEEVLQSRNPEVKSVLRTRAPAAEDSREPTNRQNRTPESRLDDTLPFKPIDDMRDLEPKVVMRVRQAEEEPKPMSRSRQAEEGAPRARQSEEPTSRPRQNEEARARQTDDPVSRSRQPDELARSRSDDAMSRSKQADDPMSRSRQSEDAGLRSRQTDEYASRSRPTDDLRDSAEPKPGARMKTQYNDGDNEGRSRSAKAYDSDLGSRRDTDAKNSRLKPYDETPAEPKSRPKAYEDSSQYSRDDLKLQSRPKPYDETPARNQPESRTRSNSKPSRPPHPRLPPKVPSARSGSGGRSPSDVPFDQPQRMREDTARKEPSRREPMSPPFSPYSEYKPRETPSPFLSSSSVDYRPNGPSSDRKERGPPPIPADKRRDSADSLSGLPYPLPQNFQVQGSRIVFPDGRAMSTSDMQLGIVRVAAVLDKTRTKLMVRVFEAVGLKAMNKDGTSDVYAKIYLMPDPKKLSKVKTSVITGTTRPKFDHMHTYKVGESLDSKRLEVSLFHRYMLKSEFLGMTEVDLRLFAQDADPYAVALWFPLQHAPIDLCPVVPVVLPRGADAPPGSIQLPDGMIWLPSGLIVLPDGDIVDPKSLTRTKREAPTKNDESPVRIVVEREEDEERGRRSSVSKPARRGSLFSNLMKPFRKSTKNIRRLSGYNYFYQALFDFSPSPRSGSTLAFAKGDILYVKDPAPTGDWWEAEDADGNIGDVPCNYLRLRCEGGQLDAEQNCVLPSGAKSMGNEARICYPDGTAWLAEQGLDFPDSVPGDELLPDGTRQTPDGCVRYPSGAYHDGRGGDTLYRPDGSAFKAKWTVPDLSEEAVSEPMPVNPNLPESLVLFELPEGFSLIPQREGPPRVRFPSGQEVAATSLSGGLLKAQISFYEEAESGVLTIDIIEIRVNCTLREAYLKCYLLPDQNKRSKQKTAILKQQHDRFAVHFKFSYKTKKRSLLAKKLQLSLMAAGGLRHEPAARLEIDGPRLVSSPAAQWYMMEDMGISRSRIDTTSPTRGGGRYVPERRYADPDAQHDVRSRVSRRTDDYDSD